MKKVLSISLLLAAFNARSQGPQQLVTVPTSPWHTAKGWLYLPQDYATSTKNYPVVFFYHGLGEAGSNPYSLLNQGIPNLIANGMRPDNIINPADGQAYSFIVLAVQDGYWSPDPNWLPYELNWLKQNYRIDSNRVYVTGLSAGGQTSFGTTVTNPSISRLIAAAVPMSPAGLSSYDPTLINQNNIETWFFTGSTDGVFTANATTYSTECNTQYPGSSRLNVYSGGHCCWNNYYNVNWHDPASGYSVWEWMLLNKRDPAQALPVKFVSVDAKKEAQNVRLTWKVSEETDVERYEIEKSYDGRSFSVIGAVQAMQRAQYNFTDASLSGKSFYRIKSIDRDGRYGYSSVLKYQAGLSAVQPKVFPVPAAHSIRVQHDAGIKEIELTSADGKVMKTTATEKGSQQTTIDLSSMQKGVHYVRYKDDLGNIETIRFIKQ